MELPNRTNCGFSAFGHTNTVYSVCTDGLLIVSGGLDKTIRIWDLHTGRHIGKTIKNDCGISVVVLSNNGRIVAGVGLEVCIWDIETSSPISTMTGHTSLVNTVALSPDNSRIASGGVDCSIRLWDTQTYTQIGKFNGHTGIIWSASFSHDGRYIASCSLDKTVRIWNSGTGQLIDLQGHTNCVTSVSFTPDNQLISGYSGTIHIWSQSVPKEWTKLSEQITSMELTSSTHSVGNSALHSFSLAGNPYVVAACYSTDYTLYAASTLDVHVSLWHIERESFMGAEHTYASHSSSEVVHGSDYYVVLRVHGT